MKAESKFKVMLQVHARYSDQKPTGNELAILIGAAFIIEAIRNTMDEEEQFDIEKECKGCGKLMKCTCENPLCPTNKKGGS